MRRIALGSILFISSLSSYAEEGYTRLETKMDVPASYRGEPVQMRISIQTRSQSYIGDVEYPLMPDWDVVGIQDYSKVDTISEKGKLVRTQEKVFVVSLRPKKAGKLRVPKFSIPIGNTVWHSEEKIVQVEKISNVAKTAPKLQNPFDDEPWTGQNEEESLEDTLDPRASFMVRADPDKLEAFVGETVIVPYYLFTNATLSYDEPNFAKFPTLNGFLKETLGSTKTIQETLVTIGGIPFRKAKLMKYALFPQRAGKLSVDPMEFSLYVLGNRYGVRPTRIKQKVASRAVDIHVKALPESPEGVDFSGSVGQFQWEVAAPQGRIESNQPFVVTIKIRGSGNIKAIEPPKFQLPDGLEEHNVKISKVSFEEDATGEKIFDFVFVARTPGETTLPSAKWAYFDPKSKKYEILSSDPIVLNVIQGASGTPMAEARGDKNDKKGPEFPPVRIEAQNFRPIKAKSHWVTRLPLVFLSASYMALGILFFARRQKQRSDQSAKERPWKVTERLLLEKASRQESQLATLIDQYTREYLVGLLKSDRIEMKSTIDEFLAAVESKMPLEKRKDLEVLQNFFRELDHIRFSGKKRDKANSKKMLARTKLILSKIEKAIS